MARHLESVAATGAEETLHDALTAAAEQHLDGVGVESALGVFAQVAGRLALLAELKHGWSATESTRLVAENMAVGKATMMDAIIVRHGDGQ